MAINTLENKIAQLSQDHKIQVESLVDSLLDMEIHAEKKQEHKAGFGSMKGLVVYMSDDFDAPLEDFKDYM